MKNQWSEGMINKQQMEGNARDGYFIVSSLRNCQESESVKLVQGR